MLSEQDISLMEFEREKEDRIKRVKSLLFMPSSFNNFLNTGTYGHPSIHPSIGTILCAERWCCLSSLIGYWAQSWMGRHFDTGNQQAGTHFADLGRMTGRVNATWY